jgi:predicted O-linked N-acetylglucosamine transferase (SPINDLY family)
MALMNKGKQEQAVLHFQQAVDFRPDLADAHNNLGLARAAQDMPDEAFACYQRALQAEPGHMGALANLGNMYKDQACLVEAIACYRRALALRPHEASIHSNLLLAMNYQPGADPQAILAEARRYAAAHAAPLAAGNKPFEPCALAGRRLRIGYVSADFREHPVANFLEPIFASHDHAQFEIFCYAACTLRASRPGRGPGGRRGVPNRPSPDASVDNRAVAPTGLVFVVETLAAGTMLRRVSLATQAILSQSLRETETKTWRSAWRFPEDLRGRAGAQGKRAMPRKWR